jgi:predicted RNA-binding Zn ribbon-like protein
MRPAAVPPFRTLDPALAATERQLTSGLSTVVDALPDEPAATARLNALLAGLGVSPRLAASGDGWRVVHVTAADRTDELATAAAGLVALVAVAGWSRVKRCETCAEPFLDRTNGRTRRWCGRHRSNHRPA